MPGTCPDLQWECPRLPTAVVGQSGRNLETAGAPPTVPPSSLPTFQANADLNTTQTGPIVGKPHCQSSDADSSCIIRHVQLTISTTSCRAPNRHGVKIAVQQKPRMKMTMRDLSPTRIFRVAGNLLLEIADGDLTLKMARVTSEVAQVAIQPTFPYIWPQPATLSHLAGVSPSCCSVASPCLRNLNINITTK